MDANILVETEGMERREWLRWRKKGIGGSDVSCLLGINKWKSEMELWLDKTNQTDEEEPENEAMEWGRIMEPVIRSHFSAVTGRAVIEVKAILQHPDCPFMLADVDGITTDGDGNPAILEIKTASEFKRPEWEDGIPAYYETQVQHYMFVVGVQKAYVAVLIGGNTFHVYEVDADAQVQAMLVEVERQFWGKVQNMVRPEVDGSDAATKLLDRVYRGGISEQIILPADALEYLDAYREACEEEENAKAKKQDAANHVKEFMGDYDRAKCQEYTVSWKPVTSERLDSKALKEKEPEVYARYAKASTSRRFTVR